MRGRPLSESYRVTENVHIAAHLSFSKHPSTWPHRVYSLTAPKIPPLIPGFPLSFMGSHPLVPPTPSKPHHNYIPFFVCLLPYTLSNHPNAVIVLITPTFRKKKSKTKTIPSYHCFQPWTIHLPLSYIPRPLPPYHLNTLFKHSHTLTPPEGRPSTCIRATVLPSRSLGRSRRLQISHYRGSWQSHLFEQIRDPHQFLFIVGKSTIVCHPKL